MPKIIHTLIFSICALSIAFADTNCSTKKIDELVKFHEKMVSLYPNEIPAIGRFLEPTNDQYTISHLNSPKNLINEICLETRGQILFHDSAKSPMVYVQIPGLYNNLKNKIEEALKLLLEIKLQKKRFDYPAPSGFKYAFNFCENEYQLIKSLHFIGYTEDNECIERDETYLPGGINYIPDEDD